MARFIDYAEQQDLYCIPLSGIVVFPHIPISIEIKEDVLISRCEEASKAGTPLLFAIKREGVETVHTKKDLYPVGCVARVRQIVKLPDGTARLLAEGRVRARISSVTADSSGNVRTGIVAVHSETEPGGVRAEGLMHDVAETLQRYVSFLNQAPADILDHVRAIRTPGELADCIAGQFLLRFEDKIDVLQEFNPLKRLELVDFFLEGEADILDAKQEIHQKVRQRIDHSQRIFYLREQMRVIQQELNESEQPDDGEDGEYYDDTQDDLGAYAEKIAAIVGDEYAEIREKLSKELKRLSKMPFGSAENSVLRNYLDICLEYPWCQSTCDRVDTAEARRILDRDHEGLQSVKERILEYLAVKQTSPQLKNQILCLVGPPGVGKSSIASSIAQAMNRKFVRVSLGGIRDEADIRGHRKTYVGAMPGRIVAAVTQSGVNNPLILLDELDKLTHDAHGDPASALLEVLDPEQNKAFRDHFTEIPMDLSNCVFIATANTLSTIPAPLLDRVEVIEIRSYSEEEKRAIADNHLIPKQLHRHGLTKTKVRIQPQALLKVIRDYTRESGVRGLEKQIAKICRKSAMMLLETGKKSLTVTEKNLSDFLGPKKILQEKISDDNEVGEVNGLAWTEAGGDMLKVEVSVVAGTGKVELTGSLGDVMKESAKIAISFVRSRAAAFGIPEDFYAKRDIHIHFPEGAVPKDGPSAGVTMVTAIVSALTGRSVRRDLAMTGEITLRGKVIPIGGLREKTMAACRAGVRTVLFPADNVSDLEEVDAKVKESIELIPVSHADEVLRLALLPADVYKAEFTQEPLPLIVPETKPAEPHSSYRGTGLSN